jgi:hypothetical protein
MEHTDSCVHAKSDGLEFSFKLMLSVDMHTAVLYNETRHCKVVNYFTMTSFPCFRKPIVSIKSRIKHYDCVSMLWPPVEYTKRQAPHVTPASLVSV